MKGGSTIKAVFAKYNTDKDMVSATETINRMQEKKCIPIEYDVVAEIACDQTQISEILNNGSINDMSEITPLGRLSVQRQNGTWQCIVFVGPDKSLLVYTGGTTEIMYYSVKS